VLVTFTRSHWQICLRTCFGHVHCTLPRVFVSLRSVWQGFCYLSGEGKTYFTSQMASCYLFCSILIHCGKEQCKDGPDTHTHTHTHTHTVCTQRWWVQPDTHFPSPVLRHIELILAIIQRVELKQRIVWVCAYACVRACVCVWQTFTGDWPQEL